MTVKAADKIALKYHGDKLRDMIAAMEAGEMKIFRGEQEVTLSIKPDLREFVWYLETRMDC